MWCSRTAATERAETTRGEIPTLATCIPVIRRGLGWFEVPVGFGVVFGNIRNDFGVFFQLFSTFLCV